MINYKDVIINVLLLRSMIVNFTDSYARISKQLCIQMLFFVVTLNESFMKPLARKLTAENNSLGCNVIQRKLSASSFPITVVFQRICRKMDGNISQN